MFRGFKFYAAILALSVLMQPRVALALSLDLDGLSHRQFSLSESPLFLGSQAEPNVLILMDDSISMSSSFTLDHDADNDGNIDKLGTGGDRDGSADQAQGMARGTDNGRLIYPWLYPLPPFFNETDGTCRPNSDVTGPNISALRLPDEEALPFCAQTSPSQDLLDALASEAWVRAEVGITSPPALGGETEAVWKLRSATHNPLYFDPAKTYAPWPGVDSAGVTHQDADPASPRLDPFDPASNGDSLDDTYEITSIVELNDGSYAVVSHEVFSRCNGVIVLGLCVGIVETIDTEYDISVYYDADGTKQDVTGAQRQNFANWFQYYRNRELVAKGLAASLVAAADGIRVAYATIHQNDAVGVAALELSAADPLDSGSKRTLLDAIYSTTAAATATPLRRALEDAGNYFRCDGSGRFADYYSASPVQESNTNVVGDNSCPVLDAGDGGECQLHNTVLVTDGYSTAHALPVVATEYPNAAGAGQTNSHNTLDPVADHDSDDDTAVDGEPYADGIAGTLADAAMAAYEDDLQPSLDGTQRMQTHTLVLAVETGGADVESILGGTGNWPTPLFSVPGSAPYEPGAADVFEYASLLTELRHATENTRGEYISGLGSGAVSQFLATLNAIGGSQLSGTNTSASSAQLNDDTLIFSTSYNFANWTGNVVAYELEDDGSLTEIWDAASQLTSDSGRTILTYDPRRQQTVSTGYGSGGIAFTEANLSELSFFGTLPLVGGLGDDLGDALGSLLGLTFLDGVGGLLGGLLGALLDPILSLILQPVLDALDLLGLGGLLDTLGIRGGLTPETVAYVRGVRANEAQNGGGLRDRAGTVLGPIFSSNPVYVGAPSFDYPDEFENPSETANQAYHQFASDNANRVPMVYVGGNDGMLHGFEAATGIERIAFVPSRILSNLEDYADPAFVPKAYVDGQISVVDVYGKYPGCDSGACWRSILVGSLGRGGQGIFALDVTEPGSYDENGSFQAGSFSEANADELVLWEFTDAGSINDALNDLIQDALCDALLGLCGEGEQNLGTLVEDFIGASIIEPLLDVLIQIDEQRGHAGLGYTLVQPNVVHTAADFGFGSDANATGDWAVIVGNGYNNTEIDLGLQDIDLSIAFDSILSVSLTGNAYAYAVDLETGQLVKTFDTRVGAFLDLAQVLLTEGLSLSLPDLTDDASSLLQTINLPTSVPNGMATTATVDVDDDRVVDYIYGGDLVGSLWKIDITSTDETQWDFADTTLEPTPFFQATDFSGEHQPITTEPIVMLHPDYPIRDGQLVLFGTGEMLEADVEGENHFTQSIYGVWDKNDDAAIDDGDKSDFLRRFITDTVSVEIDTDLNGTQEDALIRIVSGDSHDGDGDSNADGPIDWTSDLGWYLDLAEGANSSAVELADNQGERVVADPIIRNDRLLISTTIAEQAVCAPAISNWLFELDAADGSPTVFPPFDLNGDGGVTFSDLYTDGSGNTFTPAGRFSDGTYNPIPTILISNTGHEIHLTNGADGGIERTVVNPIGFERSRATWRQLR